MSLDRVLDARTERDFNGLDSFLVGRLSAFFDKKLQFSDLEEIQQSIHLVLKKRAEVYDKVRKALHPATRWTSPRRGSGPTRAPPSSTSSSIPRKTRGGRSSPVSSGTPRSTC